MKATIGDDISKAKEILLEGGLVAIPTETVYGLAANSMNVNAVAKIFEAKNRPTFDPLICHIFKQEQLKDYTTTIPHPFQILMDTFWPGPLTVILPKNEKIPDLVTSGLKNAGFRIPNHPLTLKLLEEINLPLAAPSANPFGYISPTTAKHVENQLGKKIDYILDGGPCKVGLESTIIALNTYPESEIISILRLGGISIEEIERVSGKVNLNISQNSNPKAPGMLDEHYSPHKKLILFDNILEIKNLNVENSTVILLSPSENNIHITPKYLEYLSKSGSLIEAATNLFSILRNSDSNLSDKIFCQTVPNQSIGRAINDRLFRARQK